MYSIDYSPAHRLFSVRLGGMMSVAETDDYAAALRRALLEHRPGTDFTLLIDITECVIQPQAMVESMTRHMATLPPPRATAMVSGSQLARMQVRRIMTDPPACFFDTVEEARAWLVSGAPPLAAAG